MESRLRNFAAPRSFWPSFGMVVFLFLLLSASEPARTSTAIASISGVVLDAAADRPLAGARVSLGPGRPVRSTTTDSQGRFSFAGVEPGSYYLSADKSGYVAGSLGQRFPYDLQQSLEVKESSESVTLRLWRHAIAAGILLDSAGEPQVDSVVTALRRTLNASQVLMVPVRTASTDDQGRFRLNGLPPGQYVIGALSASLRPAERIRVEGAEPILQFDSGNPTIFYPGVWTIEDATAIDLRHGDEREGLVLREPEIRRAVHVSGAVSGKEQVSGIDVQMLPVGSDGQPGRLPLSVARTNDAGVFSFDHVPQGQYLLRIVQTDTAGLPSVRTDPAISAPKIRGVTRLAVGSPTTVWSEQQIAVGTENLDAVSLPLTTGLKIRGRIVFKSSSGKEAPDDLSSISVVVRPTDSRQLRVVPITNVRSDGTFETFGLPPGRFVVTIQPPPPWIPIAITGPVLQSGDIELSDRDVEDVAVTFTDNPTVIRGSVTTPSGQRASVCSVLIFPAQLTQRGQAALLSGRTQQVRCDAKGEYVIRGLLLGDYLVAADGSGTEFWMEPQYLSNISANAQQVKVTENGQQIPVALIRR